MYSFEFLLGICHFFCPTWCCNRYPTVKRCVLLKFHSFNIFIDIISQAFDPSGILNKCFVFAQHCARIITEVVPISCVTDHIFSSYCFPRGMKTGWGNTQITGKLKPEIVACRFIGIHCLLWCWDFNRFSENAINRLHILSNIRSHRIG